MSIHMTARFQVRPKSLEICKQAITDFIAYIRENEPGTSLYCSLHEQEDETAFLHYFIFEDETAREKHRESIGVKRFTDVLYPELVGEVEFMAYNMYTTT
ncbi:MAG: antibiotic biosynthesis monooxygenase [Anaerolineales bacterium]|nr:antibiotic biosynthesis monooxygenase [Chloroflexota bacterium]MBL6983635.1 antibiotic biosynthesis monooxygenase [Anaerolineales bacterium]